MNLATSRCKTEAVVFCCCVFLSRLGNFFSSATIIMAGGDDDSKVLEEFKKIYVHSVGIYAAKRPKRFLICVGLSVLGPAVVEGSWFSLLALPCGRARVSLTLGGAI